MKGAVCLCLAKHQIGLTWNEVSRRYVNDEPELYMPEEWRKSADNVKQGSSEELIDVITFADGHSLTPTEFVEEVYYPCLATYNKLILSGVCPEQARMVLPQSMMTEWIWTGSLTAFARVCALRLDPHTQKETVEVADKIYQHLYEKFPDTFPYLYRSMDASYNYKDN